MKAIAMPQYPKDSWWKRYAYGWVTLGFFLISRVGHWLFAWFAYVGSPQSRESDERHEAKLDAILHELDPVEGEKMIAALDREYGR